MARIGDRRAPAAPETADQRERRDAIVTSAVRLGRGRDIERISAQEIAADAGVALRTLYRYYPSKYHVFAAVLNAQIVRFTPAHDPAAEPAAAVADLMAGACRGVLRYPHLAHAMITSTQVVRAKSGAVGDHSVRDVILATAGVTEPDSDDLRTARLVEQVTFGILTWAVGGELAVEDAVADVRVACRSLIGHGFGAASR